MITLDSGRARLPVRTGLATGDDGVRIAWEEFGSGDPTIILLPSAPIIHSRQWKAQIHVLSRSWRVITFDGRGNGRSDRPTDPAAYVDDRSVADIVTVLDATGTQQAVLVGLCGDGVWRSIRLATEQPDRVLGMDDPVVPAVDDKRRASDAAGERQAAALGRGRDRPRCRPP